MAAAKPKASAPQKVNRARKKIKKLRRRLLMAALAWSVIFSPVGLAMAVVMLLIFLISSISGGTTTAGIPLTPACGVQQPGIDIPQTPSGPSEPYGLPTGTNTGGYGSSGAAFPKWVHDLEAQFQVKASTYPGHQESDRHEIGYAPNPQHLNRGIDWTGSVPAMQKFATALRTIAPANHQLEQIIWWNPDTNQKIGWAEWADQSNTPYYNYAGGFDEHRDHVHTRFSASISMSGQSSAQPAGPGATAVADVSTAPAASPTPQPPTTAPTPQPPGTVTAADWEKVAKYESGGNWADNTGNGYFGGLQFSPQTWKAFGGDQYAPSADKASKQQQMEVANKVLAAQGWNAWPQTSFRAGVRDAKPAPAGTFVNTATPLANQAAANAPPQDQTAQTDPDQTQACNEPSGVGSNNLKPGTVPPQWQADVQRAGTVCPEIPASIIAAQIEQESNWNPNAQSHDDSGNVLAVGLSQFLPGTWGSTTDGPGAVGYGADGDGDGKRDPYNPHDAIAAQAKYDCAIVAELRPLVQSGKVHGNLTELALAGYNAGEGAVVQYGGIPPYAQTQAYVPDIIAKSKKYEGVSANPNASGPPQIDGKRILIRGTPFAQKFVEVASLQQGLPYIWGGGNKDGPTGGGFDCSGLVLYAAVQAAKTVLGQDWSNMPHYTGNQVNDPRAQHVALSDIQPGDAIYENGDEHVAIWLGGGKVLEASTFGVPVGVHSYTPVPSDHIRRFG